MPFRVMKFLDTITENLPDDQTVIKTDMYAIAWKNTDWNFVHIVLNVIYITIGNWKGIFIGILGVLGFGYALIINTFIVCRGLQERPFIVLTPSGIKIWNPATNMEDFVSWDHVTSLKVLIRNFRRSQHTEQYLLLNLADPSPYLAKGNPLQRAMRHQVYRGHGSPLVLSVYGLKIESFKKLCQVTNQYYEHSKTLACEDPESGAKIH